MKENQTHTTEKKMQKNQTVVNIGNTAHEDADHAAVNGRKALCGTKLFHLHTSFDLDKDNASFWIDCKKCRKALKTLKDEKIPIKDITIAQLKVLMRAEGTVTPTNHGAERDEAHENFMIPVHGRHENKSARAMERKGWGYTCSKAPHDHTFFRPINGLIQEAKNHPDSRWV